MEQKLTPAEKQAAVSREFREYLGARQSISKFPRGHGRKHRRGLNPSAVVRALRRQSLSPADKPAQ